MLSSSFQVAIAECHGLGGLINDGNFFLMVLGNLLVQDQVAGKFCG